MQVLELARCEWIGALVVAIDAGVADFGGSVLDAVDLGVGVAGVVGDGFRAGADPGVTLARQRAGR